MKISEFLSENFQFLVVKFSIYLNRRASAMEYVRPAKIQICLRFHAVCSEYLLGVFWKAKDAFFVMNNTDSD